MKFTDKELIKKSRDPETLGSLLALAEEAYKTWQELWSPFIEAPIIEETLKIFEKLNEINCFPEGGYPGAERKMILFKRDLEDNSIKQSTPPLIGLKIEGNFLFDKTEKNDFLKALTEEGVKSSDLGDVWIIGDRGAQLICSERTGLFLNNKEGKIRDVQIKYEIIETSKMRLPVKRIPKTITTVEASTRLDAIASAGFGLSRSKIAIQIKAGNIRLNWQQITQGNRSVNKGDRIQLEGKGQVVIKNIDLTKKDRWRILLQRE